MKIINLRGTCNTGKTTTLNYLIDVMQIISSAYEIRFNRTANEDEKDRKAWFEYKGHIIGICTSGDTEEAVSDNFHYCQENECEIAVVASHLRDDSFTRLCNLARYHMCEIEKIRINSASQAKEKTIELLDAVLQNLEAIEA